MTELEQVEPDPKPPDVGAYVAACLEIGMLAVFAYEQSVVGMLLWIPYYWFSATRAIMSGMFVA